MSSEKEASKTTPKRTFAVVYVLQQQPLYKLSRILGCICTLKVYYSLLNYLFSPQYLGRVVQRQFRSLFVRFIKASQGQQATVS